MPVDIEGSLAGTLMLTCRFSKLSILFCFQNYLVELNFDHSLFVNITVIKLMLLAGESVMSMQKSGSQQLQSNFTNFTGRHHIRSKILVDGQTALHMTALHTVIRWFRGV